MRQVCQLGVVRDRAGMAKGVQAAQVARMPWSHQASVLPMDMVSGMPGHYGYQALGISMVMHTQDTVNSLP